MKFFTLILLLSIPVLSQGPADRKSVGDWSSIFPEIPGCERVVQPLRRDGKIIEQIAEYEPENYKKYKNNPDFPNYINCGSITLRVETSARKKASAQKTEFRMMPLMPTTVKGFFALRDGPQCGNDPWIGSTAVYFDTDKVLIVSANHGAYKIIEFAETADYRAITKIMGKFRGNRASLSARPNRVPV